MRMLRKPKVADKVGLCARQIDELEAAGLFPKRVVLSPNRGPKRGRAVAWVEQEIDSFLEERAASRAASA